MQTVFLIKEKIGGHNDIIRAIFSKKVNAYTYILDCKEDNTSRDVWMEQWSVDSQV